MKSIYTSMLFGVLIIGGGAVWYSNHHTQDTVAINPPIYNTPTPTPVVEPVRTPPASTPTPVPTPVSVILQITSITPSSGPTGSIVTIRGTGFDSKSNLILFGNSGGGRRRDGSPDNAYANTASADGKTIVFQIPTSGPSGIICDLSNQCVAISAILLQPGVYPIAVKNMRGTSNSKNFSIMK